MIQKWGEPWGVQGSPWGNFPGGSQGDLLVVPWAVPGESLEGILWGTHLGESSEAAPWRHPLGKFFGGVLWRNPLRSSLGRSSGGPWEILLRDSSRGVPQGSPSGASLVMVT